MSTTRTLAHTSVIQIVGKIASTLLGLSAIGIMTRYLGPEQFGWYVAAISFLQFIGILTDFGLIPVSAQMLSEPRFEKKKLLQNLLGFRFVTSVFFLGLAPLLVLAFPYPIEVKQAVAVMTVSFLAIALNQIFTGFFQQKLRMQVQVGGEILGRLVLVSGLWFLVARHASFLPIMALVSISSIVYTACMWVGAARLTRPTFGFDLSIWKAIVAKSWPIAISVIFNVIYLKGDVILLSIFRDLSEVGVYGAAYRVVDILAQTAMLVMGIILPLLAHAWSRGDKKTFTTQFQQAFDGMMALGVPIVVGVFILAKPIMLFVAGEKFASSSLPLGILSLAVGAVYLGAIFGHVAVAIDKQKQTMWIYISGAVFTVIGYLYFIPRFGMIGAAWMSVFSEMYVALLLAFTVKRYANVSLKTKAFAKILFSSIIMGLVLKAMPDVHILVTVSMGVCVYAGSMIATKGISKATLKEILSRNE